MNRPALVVDGLSVFHSVAGPAAQLTNGFTYSFVVQLTSAIKKFNPRGIFVCWDRGSAKREALLPDYKGQRESSMNDVKQKYLDDVQRFLHLAGADQLHADGFEADDIGAMLANTLDSAILISNDKDWLQLVRPGISVYHRCRIEGRKNEKKLITHENFSLITGWNSPDELVRGLCAMGDAVDNIPGIPGIGDTSVRAYLMGMSVGPGKQKLLDDFFAGSEHYALNKKLIELRDIKEIPDLVMTAGKFDEGALKSLLEELTFASMLKNFPVWVQPYKEAAIDANISS